MSDTPQSHNKSMIESPSSLSKPSAPRKEEQQWKSVQLRVSKEFYQHVNARLKDFNQRTGMNFSFATLTLQTLEEHWMIQLERAAKSYERYRRHKDAHNLQAKPPAVPPMFQQ
ncbi:MAG: hypothetical protein PHV34_14040 [Verrucomicrobiae bacterium]|nr:hypothetical protein [Verrucomicrobiae bacterium]